MSKTIQIINENFLKEGDKMKFTEGEIKVLTEKLNLLKSLVSTDYYKHLYNDEINQMLEEYLEIINFISRYLDIKEV